VRRHRWARGNAGGLGTPAFRPLTPAPACHLLPSAMRCIHRPAPTAPPPSPALRAAAMTRAAKRGGAPGHAGGGSRSNVSAAGAAASGSRDVRRRRRRLQLCIETRPRAGASQLTSSVPLLGSRGAVRACCARSRARWAPVH